MAGREIGEELVEQIVADLQARYALDDDDVRGLGTKLGAQRKAHRECRVR